MKYITAKDVNAIEGVSIFRFSLNLRAIKMFEFGSACLCVMGVLIYPLTHYEPRQWMAATVALAIMAVVTFATAWRWRKFVCTEFVGWDADNFYVSQGNKGVAVIPWNAMTLENTGLKNPDSGSVLNVCLAPGEPIVALRLVTGFIIVDNFKNVLATILTHIKENMDREKAEQAAVGEASADSVVTASEKATAVESAVDNVTGRQAEAVANREVEEKTEAASSESDA